MFAALLHQNQKADFCAPFPDIYAGMWEESHPSEKYNYIKESDFTGFYF